MGFTYKYPRPMVTVDLVVLAPDLNGVLHVLLVKRGKEPFKGCLAIPGGFLNDDEFGQDAAIRELREETGYNHSSKPWLLMVCDTPDRDPRGRVISLAYLAVLDHLPPVQGSDDAVAAYWVPIDDAVNMTLAFDHNRILEAALEH